MQIPGEPKRNRFLAFIKLALAPGGFAAPLLRPAPAAPRLPFLKFALAPDNVIVPVLKRPPERSLAIAPSRSTEPQPLGRRF